MDTLIYGCTHYPLLEPIFQKIYSEKGLNAPAFVDPAVATIQEAQRILQNKNLSAPEENKAEYKFIWSGIIPTSFQPINHEHTNTKTQKHINISQPTNNEPRTTNQL
jgi:glutamate racemase